ncbi:MAG TPA: hypothetical protein VH724_15955 [Candidatus Angelobacter sp.]|nr:hypothetical protein [Candidatus Angelobacter sp.]
MSSEKLDAFVRPMRVFVARNSKADASIRSRVSMPAVRAPGIPSTPKHDLIFHGGNTIADLIFMNFFVGGSSAWNASDIKSINDSLAAAMSDKNLNNVMSQYYPSGLITSTFQGSQILAGPKPSTVSQGDVENLVRRLFQTGTLNGVKFLSTVLNFMLPSGTVLNTDLAPTTGAISATVETAHDEKGVVKALASVVPPQDAEDSKHGLGGYHGSIHVGTGSAAQTIYYAVGVFSEQLTDGTVNGIPAFDKPWKNVVATFYHELNEARTDPDVEDAINAGNSPNAIKFLGWTSAQGEECGDFPVFEANPLTQVFQEVKLTHSQNTVPVQFQYSDADHGPGEPRPAPAPFAGSTHVKHHKAG